ncbi:MAG: asparaginase [Cryomorphaceae bacterium]|nr:asparaginase [Cryomorphaceae bacterium]MBT7739518.1 asparaginase [Cryomorphaceae bacterium]
MMLEILTTGGTIDKVYFDKKSNYEVGDPFVEELLHKMNVNISFKVKSLMKIDSLEMTDIHREEILNYIKNSNSINFLITHGTDSIVETAIYLKKISDKTIVLTGSLKPAIFIDNDAIFNVGSALTSAQILKNGVYIVINGQVFNPDNVRKNLEKNIFETIN